MNQQVKSTLAALHRGQQVTVIYDGKFEHQRLRVTGKVVTVDHFWETLQVNKVAIDFSEIYEIIRLGNNHDNLSPSLEGDLFFY